MVCSAVTELRAGETKKLAPKSTKKDRIPVGDQTPREAMKFADDIDEQLGDPMR